MPLLHTGNVELAPAVAGRAALIRNLPAGFGVVQSGIRPTALAGAGVLARVRLGSRLYAEALPEVSAVFVRDRLRVRDGDRFFVAHRPSPFEIRVSVGVVYEY